MFKRLQHIIVSVLLLISSTQAFAQLAMPDNVCVGATKTYSVNTVSPPVGSTYTWQIDGVTQSTTTNAITITWNTVGTFTLTVQEHGAGGCDGPLQSGTVVVNPLPTVIVNSPPVCAGGTATVTASPSPAGTYNYVWTVPVGVSPPPGNVASFTTTVAGNYSVIITNTVTNCSASGSGTVTFNPLPTASITATNILCNGAATGSATVTAGGGTAPYTYSWSPSGGTAATASGLVAGTYTVTVTDSKGCFIKDSITISQPPAITAIATSTTNATCGAPNGTLTLGTVTGGTSPYSYSVDGSAFTSTLAYINLAGGSHTINVKDANGCIFSTTAVVISTTGPTVSATAGSIACNGGTTTITVVASGGSGSYTYGLDSVTFQAGNVFTNISAGTYSTITVKDGNGCTAEIGSVV